MAIAVTSASAIRDSQEKSASGAIPPSRIEYIGVRPDRGGAGKPQAFTVKMEPNQEFGPHYHTVAQYQLILFGDGRIGRRPLATYAVHYTDGYTGYGPLVAGERGMHYMTLRASADPGPQYIATPGARERMKPSRRRFLLQSGIEPTSPGDAMDLSAPRTETIFEPQDDGACCVLLRLGPGMSHSLASGASVAGGGYFLVVLRGELHYEDVALDQHSTVWVAPQELAPPLESGSQGADVLMMQFPGAASETDSV